MLVKTRKAREIRLTATDLRSLSESELNELCQNLYNFSLRNTQEITPEYLMKRIIGYSILCLVYSGDQIVGFGFADYRELSLGLLKKFPLIHFGLMIIDRDWRGERISRFMTKSIIRFVVKKAGLRVMISGFAVSAKCSSPVSFYRLQQGSFNIGFPKFNRTGDLHFLSRSKIGKTLSQSIAKALNLGTISDYLLLNSNTESGFKLSKEEYITNSAYEEKVLNFFKKNVIPDNEVLFITYAHPIFAV
jgi:hypothetical protein